MLRSRPIRVFIGDDHVALREGLRMILEQAGFEVVGGAGTIEGTLEGAGDAIDIWILDPNMGEMRGTRAIEMLLDRKKDARIVVYSMRASMPAIGAAYEAGALAYVTKNAEPRILVDAINHVDKGEMYFMPGFAEKLAVYHARDKKADPKRALRPRELEIFIMLAEGRQHGEIASTLGVSKKSIQNASFTIRRKLGVERTDFTRLALEYNLIDNP